MIIPDEMIEELRLSAAMIREWAPETFPANEQGQVHFARAVMESVAESIEKALAAAPASAPEPERQKLIGIGMAMGASVIMQGWGDTIHAKEILGAAGFNSEADLVAGEVDEYDINLLRPIFAPG